MANSPIDWNYRSENDGYAAQTHLEKVINLIRGKMLGGTSGSNFMIYIRGQPHDYDEWVKAAKDDTWSYENVLPFFKKSERLDDDGIKNSHFAEYHGFDGYLGITKQYLERNYLYMKGFEELGHKLTEDLNGNETLGYAHPMYTRADGVRYSTARAFLTPIKDRKNLHVFKNTLVTKVLFDEQKNAIGIEALTEDKKLVTIRAGKEVILSAGAFNSPQILMLSGIGPKEHLESFGIEVLVDSPIGKDLQDHASAFLAMKLKNEKSVKLPHLPTEIPVDIFMGMATINRSQKFPDYETINIAIPQVGIESAYALSFCSFFLTLNDDICQSYFDAIKTSDVLFTLLSFLHPESRGEVLLRSTNPTDPPKIKMGYFSNDIDLDRAAKCLKDFLRVTETKVFKKMGAELVRPSLPECDLHPYGSNEYFRCFVLSVMFSEWHFCGTCRMGSVVDSQLNLNGVKRLRVIDASVIPYINGANINAAVIMIAEKGSHFVQKTYGLSELKRTKKHTTDSLGLASNTARETKLASMMSVSDLQLNFVSLASKLIIDKIYPLLY